MRRIAFIFMLLLAWTVLLSSCRREKEPGEKGELVLLCGSSFVPPTEQLCSEFTARTGIKVSPTSAGSESLLPLIKVGEKGDIFITHDPYLDYTADANALQDHVRVGFVVPVLVVQKGNPKGVRSIEDLTRSGLEVALTDPNYSTCGEMVFELLEAKGIKDAVMKNVENRLVRQHSDLGTLLKTKTVDAGIMWKGVAYIFSDDLEIVPTPYEYDEEIRVHIIGLSYSKQPELLRKFIEFTRNRGPEIFAKHGYVK